MNMSHDTPPEHESSETPEMEAERDDAAPSDAFAKALEDFEHGAGPQKPDPRPIRVGAKLRGKLVSIGDDQSMVDVGGRSEGAIETRQLKDASGALRHQPG